MATQTINYSYPLAGLAGTDRSAHDLPIAESLNRESRWAEKARRLVSAHAAHDNTVIFEGEPGTGKHFLARLIHQCSRYSEGPFVAVTLGSSTDDVARAVLFGRPRPRFDDLACGEKGLIELAVGGTLYVDGLLDTSPRLTDSVVRFIEDAGLNGKGDGALRTLFGSTTHSSGSQWRSSISPRSQGMSREKIQIPPLRERRDDIEALAGYFVKRRCEDMRKESRVLSPQTVAALINYDWPRNVSELVSVVNHLVRQSKPPSLDVRLLPAYLQGFADLKNTPDVLELDLDDEVKKFEINLICTALRQSRGLQNKAAQMLRIRPTTLFMKIKRFNIDVADFR